MSAAGSTDTILQILAAAREAGIDLWLEDNKLRFRAPKGALTPTLRAQLREYKPQLIEYLAEQEVFAAPAAKPQAAIPRADRSGHLPLSRSQLRLWLVDRMQPGRPHYNEVLAGRVFGKIDFEKMRAAAEFMAQRHEILRTTFEHSDGEVRQHIHASLPPQIVYHDLRDWPTRLREAELDRMMDRLCMQPFELDKGPLHRIHLVQLDEEEHLMVHVLHHIICDAWSTLIYLRELAAAYSALRVAQEPQLPALPMQFADYALWLERRLQAGEFDDQLKFWRAELDGLPPVMPMPLDRPRGQAQADAGGESVNFRLGENERRDLETLARSRQATPFMALLAVWAGYLNRWSGAEDFAIGTPVANRSLPELQGQIGFYVNTLPLRIRTQANPALTELIDRIRSSSMMSVRNQDVPFDQLVAELAPERNATHPPIFQVMFIYEEEAPDDHLIDDLRLELYPYKLPVAKFDLSLVAVPLHGGYHCYLEFDRNLFDRDHAEQMAADFTAFVRATLAASTEPIGQIDFGDSQRAEDLQRVLDGKTRPLPAAETIVSLFRKQVEKTPAAVALRIENQQLSYAELDAQSNRVAHALARQGVGCNSVVGLAFVGGSETVIGALGILKCGAAYMPLDPGYPAARRDVMLQRADVKCILCLRSTAASAQDVDGLKIVCIDDLPKDLPVTAPDLPVYAHARAHVIFTSGSTGEPKGVAITHANVIRFVLDSRMADVRPADVFLQFAAPAFDLSTFEMWTPLVHGASLACLPEPDHSLENLGRLIRLHGVSILWLTAGLYHAAIDEDLPALLLLRRLLAGGEALAPDKTAKLRARFSGDLVDGYGPTENCVFTSMYSIPADFDGARSVPIGTPLDNSPLYVLNDKLVRQRPGVIGTLYAGGAGVAQSYVGRPALTAERFIPDPFSDIPGARMYNTGDRVRLLRSGQLEFHGRADRQVKLRGFRIEPADIELQLRKHPAIQKIHVAVPDGAQQLAAWFVAADDFVGDEATLLDSVGKFAESKLPGYLRPAVWLRVEQMPLTTNGKLDVNKLPAAFEGAGDDDSRPANALEERLWQIWSELLGQNEFGVETSFFVLGGQSLKAMQMATRLERRGIKGFTVRLLFDYPTIRLLAEQLEDETVEVVTDRSVIGDTSQKSLESGGITPSAFDSDLALSYPASFAQQRLWLLQKLSASSAYNVPLMLRSSARLDAQLLKTSLGQLMRRHAVLRTQLSAIDALPQQTVLPAADCQLPFEILDLSAKPNAATELEYLALEHSHLVFDLAKAPLWKCTLVCLPEGWDVLLLTVHHVIIDAGSARVVLNDLAELYSAGLGGRETHLTALTTSFAEFAQQENQKAAAGRYAKHLEFWSEHLQGAPPLLDLPYDFVRPANPQWNAGYVNRRISAKLFARLEEVAQREGTTTYMLLLAAYVILLQKHGRADNLVLGTPFAQHVDEDYANVAGYFVNTLPLHFRIDSRQSCREWLHEVRRVALEAFEHAAVPLDLIVDRVQPERSRSHTPLFQTLFAVQPHVADTLKFGDDVVEVRPGGERAAKFDLTLDIRPHGSEWDAEFEFAAELFEEATVVLFAERYLFLLQELAELPAGTDNVQSNNRTNGPAADASQISGSFATKRPTKRLSDLRLEAEIISAAGTDTHYSTAVPLFEQFARRAAEQPQAIALSFEGRQQTYADLHAAAGSIAAALHNEITVAQANSAPGNPEARIGILFERGLELPAAIVGTHMAGAAYVPLDPAYPAERLAHMAEAAELTLILCGPGVQAHDYGVATLSYDAALERATTLTFEPRRPLPDSLAYIIFTSGSTGKPKGVGITHANCTRLFAATDPLYGFDSSDVWTLFHSYAFDFSVWEIWGALIHGGRLVIVPQASARDSAKFHTLLQREAVTVLNLTPTAFQHLLTVTAAAPAAQRPKNLRLLIFGGEALNTASLQAWFEMYTDDAPQVFNMFGITETTVHVTARRVRSADVTLARSPIGAPLGDLRLMILDSAGREAPVGVPGELFVAGAGLARAYLGANANAAGLTAARFLPTDAGARMYRTGDLARRRRDGDIEYLGRNDFQVQLRGFRIELGEIEHAISSHPAVKSALVLLHGDADPQSLVAWYLADTELSETDLTNHCASRLPAYMLPQAWVRIDVLPLTPTGKIDRAALPAPQTSSAGTEFRSVTAKTIAGIMSELLNNKEVKADDNFFALGGHSLLVTRLGARMRSELGGAPSLNDLFDRPSPNTLAELLERQQPNGAASGKQEDPRAQEQSTDSNVPSSTANDLTAGSSINAPGMPAAYGQERLWILQKLTPHAARAYIVSLWLDIAGQFNSDAFWSAWELMQQRHAILRTTFLAHEGVPRLFVQASLPVQRLEHDLRNFASAEAQVKLEELTRRENEIEFDLEAGPLCRIRLVFVDAQHTRILLTFDHSIIDAWSREILVRELMQAYDSINMGHAFTLPAAPRSFAELASLQRAEFEQGKLQNSLDYWLTRLADMPPLLELPGDMARPSRASFKGALVPVRLDVSASDALRELARSEGISLFVVVLSAFKLLLARYTMRDDIVVGTPVANRQHPDSHSVVGYFLNTLVLRSLVNTEGSFRDVLDIVRGTVREAFEHQDVPFEHLVKELDAGRERSHAPLVQIMFMLQHNDELYAPDGLRISMDEAERTSAKFDLTFGLYDDGQGTELRGGLEFNSDLFKPRTIELLAERLQRVFSLFITETDARIQSVPVLTPSAERSQQGTAPRRVFAGEDFLFKQFERQALERPDAIALRFEGESRSYGRLWADARSIAAGLAAEGAGPDKLIGLMLRRSLDLPAAIIGIHMAGAAYVPLDPGYPADRLEYMAADAGLHAVLSDLDTPIALNTQTLDLADILRRGTELATPSSERLDPQNLAYIIYTSGSTGKPKGVAVTHSNVSRLFDSARELYTFGSDDVWTLFHSYAFDFSVWEMWGALTHGGRLVIVPRSTARDPRSFYDLLHGEGVTVLNQTPSAFMQLQHVAVPEVADANLQKLTTLRLVIFGGEALQTAALRSWFESYGDDSPQLFNMFGITETTVHVTARRIRKADCVHGGSPIGAPLADLSLDILDEGGFAAAAGVPGELYVSGGGISRGYLGRPALTAERFLPAPGGARMYRTGDIVLRPATDVQETSAAGIEYLRRRDFQVQLRGYRIELGEIEHVLAQHPNVAECHVMLREDNARPRIVAYVVARGPFNGAVLREHLRSGLPAYMLPAAIVALPSMPLTPTGKLNRRALPLPSAADNIGSQLQSPAVEILCGLMAGLLETEDVASADDFFALGGHSLLVTRLAAEIRNVFGKAPSPAEIFEQPSAAGIAKLLNKNTGQNLPALLPQPGAAAGEIREAPLAFGQERIWVLLRMAPQTAAAYVVPFWIDIEGALNTELLFKAWDTLVARHAILRTHYPAHDKAIVQAAVSANPLGRLPEDLSALDAAAAEQELNKLAQAQAAQSFDVTSGPLHRFTVVRLSATRHRVLLTLHHISVDAWSCDILLNDLMRLYAEQHHDAGTNSAPEPQDRAIEFTDYAAWQRQVLSEGHLNDSRAYWKHQLEGLPPLLELPGDRPRPPQQSYSGSQMACTISVQESDLLRALARREGVTPFMLLLAVFNMLLARYAMRSDIAVGSPIANRSHADSHGLVGFFLNMLVLRSSVKQHLKFREFLQQVRRTVLDAHHHQDVPFELLVEELVQERALSHAPLVQVVFVLQQQNEVQAPEGLNIEVGHTYLPTSKFDLTLGLEDAGPGTALQGGFEYNTDIFDAASITDMQQRFQLLLMAVLHDSELTLADVTLLDESELAQQLKSGRQPARAAQELAQSYIQRCFAAAAANPAAIAVDTGAQQWTYAQLFNTVAQVRAALMQLGVTVEVPVAAALPRGIELLVLQLAVFSAGGVYVPLDPQYPAVRRARMLQLADCRLLVAPAGRTEDFAGEHPQVRIVNYAELHDGREAETEASSLSAAALAGPSIVPQEHAAYVIFTSGSTGEPKGVVNSYSALANTIAGIAGKTKIGPGDRYFSFASSYFDVSLYDFLAPLCHGACLCMLPTANLTPGAPLAESLLGSRATQAFLTPSAAAALPADVKFPELRYLLMGAEAVSADLVRRFEGVQVINLYGPTEAAICTTLYECSADDERPPIGFGLPGVETLILDANMQPVPAGMIGELWIGGAGLARNYAQSPAATAQKFMPHPYAAQPGERIYRSGDLARVRRDGAIEFLGRRDHQIKLRGFRVELGEIEHCLRSLETVGDACVILRGKGKDESLIAYVTASGLTNSGEKSALDAHSLRRRLSGSLPRFMLPDVIVIMDKLPLTTNGKLDRAALPAPDRQQDRQRTMHADWTALERGVAEIWSEILPQAAPEDLDANFFEHGGNSLRAVTLLDRLRAEYYEHLQINELFDNTTIRAQAALLLEYGAAGAAADGAADETSGGAASDSNGAAAGAGTSTEGSKDGALRRVDF